MKAKTKESAPSRLVLRAETAADLMTRDPLSVREDTTLREGVAFLIDHGFSAAPVIDRAGRAVGVLSQSDIVIHDRETVRYVPEAPDYYSRTELRAATGEGLGAGFQVEDVDRTRVRDLMTPVVFSVPPDASAREVVANMLQLAVHRLFVIDRDGVLVGVVSAFDVLRHLKADGARVGSPAAADTVLGCEPW